MLAPQTGTADGFLRAATCEFVPPKVDKTLDFYDVTYQVEVTPPGKAAIKLDGKETIRAWPKTVKVKFTSDDADDKKAVKFVISSTSKVSSTLKKTASDGVNGTAHCRKPLGQSKLIPRGKRPPSQPPAASVNTRLPRNHFGPSSYRPIQMTKPNLYGNSLT